MIPKPRIKKLGDKTEGERYVLTARKRQAV